MKVVVKFTTHKGDVFYNRVPYEDVWKTVEGVIDSNGNIFEVDVLEDMTEEEYNAILASREASDFFGES